MIRAAVTIWAIPSPSRGVWFFGPVPVRAYALCILVGIAIATWLAERRWTAQGGNPGAIVDLLMWAIPGGLAGARLYHVATNPELYFGAARDPVQALYVWNGGLGIWGAIAGGLLAASVAARRQGLAMPEALWAATPGLPLAQAVGRLGNYFNQELFGRPTQLPWGLAIDPDRRPDGFEAYSTFHPTFLYEAAWNVALAGFLIWCGRRWKLTGPELLAVYVMGYTAGRFWIESLRIDPAHLVLGLRLNEWTSVLLFLTALIGLVLMRRAGGIRSHPGGRPSPRSHPRLGAAPKTSRSESAPLGSPASPPGHEPDPSPGPSS